MADPRNPYLPAKPEDAKHSFQGPTDLGGNSRCTFCGAYQGSSEGNAPCEGEYRESGKMRLWAEQKWAAERARANGQPRRIALICSEQLAPRRVGGVMYSTRAERFVILECGHRVSCQLHSFDDDPGIEEYKDEERIYRGCAEGSIEVFGCAECAKRFAGSSSGSQGKMLPAAQIELNDRPDLKPEWMREIEHLLGGGLDDYGKWAWLNLGDPSRVQRIEGGHLDEVVAEAESYKDSPAT